MPLRMKLVISFGLLVLLVLLVWSIRGQLFSFECEDTVKSEVSSPDHALVASVIERDCGATTEISTMLSLREASQPFDPKMQGAAFIISGVNDISIQWSGLRDLSVSFTDGEIFRQDRNSRGVSITYKLSSGKDASVSPRRAELQRVSIN